MVLDFYTLVFKLVHVLASQNYDYVMYIHQPTREYHQSTKEYITHLKFFFLNVSALTKVTQFNSGNLKHGIYKRLSLTKKSLKYRQPNYVLTVRDHNNMIGNQKIFAK